MASQEEGGQGGQLGKMREVGGEEEPASNQRGQAESLTKLKRQVNEERVFSMMVLEQLDIYRQK